MTTRTRHLIKEEEAVSPVIGVILMVAITVILAAVIGAFVFGMGGSLSKTYTVAVTATQVDSDDVDVTFQGGPDANLVDYMNVSILGTEFQSTPGAAEFNTTIASSKKEDDGVAIPVGSGVTITGATSGRDHVVVTATFMDGTQQIVLDTYV